jgi:hypothetical protein
MAHDDETTPIAPSGSRWEPLDSPAEDADASAVEQPADAVAEADSTQLADDAHSEEGPAEATDVEDAPSAGSHEPITPVAQPGWRSRLATKAPSRRGTGIGAGVLALVLLGGAGGFALGQADDDHDGRDGHDGQRISDDGHDHVPGMPGRSGGERGDVDDSAGDSGTSDDSSSTDSTDDSTNDTLFQQDASRT